MHILHHVEHPRPSPASTLCVDDFGDLNQVLPHRLIGDLRFENGFLFNVGVDEEIINHILRGDGE